MGLVLERIRESRTLIHFVRERLPHYGPLASSDLRLLGEEIVKATVGACTALVAGVIFACFLSVAAIVLAWNGLHPIAATCLAWAPWGLLALIGLTVVRKAIVSCRLPSTSWAPRSKILPRASTLQPRDVVR